MKKIIFIFLFSLINVIFATEEKVYRYIKITNPVENKKSKRLLLENYIPMSLMRLIMFISYYQKEN